MYQNEAQITNSVASRGFFIRTCGYDLTNVLLFKFYAYKPGLVKTYAYQKNSDGLMRTNQPDAGFVPQETDPLCKVLQVRGVAKLTIVI